MERQSYEVDRTAAQYSLACRSIFQKLVCTEHSMIERHGHVFQSQHVLCTISVDNANRFHRYSLTYHTHTHAHTQVGLNKHTGTRCSHWHGNSDILALLAPCCNRFYACAECHDEVNARPRGDGHTLEPWPANTDLDTMALLCGNCKRTFTISAYVL